MHEQHWVPLVEKDLENKKKNKHIDTELLWIHQIAAQQRLTSDTVLGNEHPADMYTKHLDWFSIMQHSKRLSCEFVDGRLLKHPNYTN